MRRNVCYSLVLSGLTILTAGLLWQALTLPGSNAASATASLPTATAIVETRIVEVTARPTQRPTREPQPTNEPYRSPVPTRTSTPPYMTGPTGGESEVGDG